MLLNNKTIQTYTTSIAFKIICVAIAFLNSILINRCLGVALRGEYTTILTVANLLQLVTNLGIGTAYPKFKRSFPNISKDIFSTLTYIILFIYIIILIPILLASSSNVFFISILTISLSIENVLLFIAIIENVQKRNLINIFTSLLHTLLLAIAYKLNPKNLEIVLWIVIIDHIILCIVIINTFKLFAIKFHFLNYDNLKGIFKLGFPAMMMNLLIYLNYHEDVLFLSMLQKDNTIIGLYGTGVTLGNMLWIIPDAFKDILFNRSAKKDNPKEIIISIWLNVFICTIIVISFIFIGKSFLVTMYGEEFKSAFPITLLIFLGTFPMILYKLIHPIYIANGKTRIVVSLLLIAVISNTIGNFLLIPNYAAYGAAISTIISYSMCGLIFYFKFSYDYNISSYFIIRTYITKYLIHAKHSNKNN